MRKVFICSPLRGNVEENKNFARERCREEIVRGNIPFAPHLYFTLFLDDEYASERELGIEAGLEIMDMCDDLRICGDTVSEGMEKEILHWIEKRKVKK